MFGRLKRVRIKAAENALKQGRLDDAFRLGMSEDLQDDRRAKQLVARTANALWERAKRHYDAGRYSEALIDLERAGRAGRDRAEVAELSSEIRAAAHQSQYRHKQKEGRLAAARDRIEDGSLVGGRRILAQASAADLDARRLGKEAEARERFAREEVAEARKLMKQNQVAAAIERYRRAAKLDAHSAEIRQLEADLCRRVFDEAARDVRDGRVDRAAQALAGLGELGRLEPDRRELDQIVERATRAARLCERGDFLEALREVQRVRHMLPKADWLRDVQEQLERIDQARAALLAGPLGLLLPAVSGRPSAEPRRGPSAAAVPVRASQQPTVGITPTPGPPTAGLPDRLLLLVDGAGSFLLLRGDRASIGRLAPGSGGASPEVESTADIALLADLAGRHAEIARVEDDYFLFARRDVLIDGRAVHQKMLADGDRITLGRKAQLTFRLPSRKSPSAVLDLAGGVRTGNDVRRVVLFCGHATVGNSSTCHIRVPAARCELVIFERASSLYVRPFAARPEERFNGVAATPVRLGEHMDIEGIGLSFEPWRVVAS